jgi:hypothetical protein
MRNVNMPFVVGLMLAATLIGAGTGWAEAPAGWVERSVDREVARLKLSRGTAAFPQFASNPRFRREAGFNVIPPYLAPWSGSVPAS